MKTHHHNGLKKTVALSPTPFNTKDNNYEHHSYCAEVMAFKGGYVTLKVQTKEFCAKKPCCSNLFSGWLVKRNKTLKLPTQDLNPYDLKTISVGQKVSLKLNGSALRVLASVVYITPLVCFLATLMLASSVWALQSWLSFTLALLAMVACFAFLKMIIKVSLPHLARLDLQT